MVIESVIKMRTKLYSLCAILQLYYYSLLFEKVHMSCCTMITINYLCIMFVFIQSFLFLLLFGWGDIWFASDFGVSLKTNNKTVFE